MSRQELKELERFMIKLYNPRTLKHLTHNIKQRFKKEKEDQKRMFD
jgi:hypothetical protein